MYNLTGVYLVGYVLAGSEYKPYVERSFYAIGHGLLIHLFSVSIGLSSDYRALAGHWTLMFAVLFVAVVGKLVGCGLAALASGIGWVRSLRIGCGMMSRGEVGLIVTAMGASTGIFRRPEVAVMVAVVLLTTLLTPLALRAAFSLKSDEDLEGTPNAPEERMAAATEFEMPLAAAAGPDDALDEPAPETGGRMELASATPLLSFGRNEAHGDRLTPALSPARKRSPAVTQLAAN